MKANPFNAKLPPARDVDKTTVLHSARAHVPGRRRATASLAAAVLTTALAGCSRTVTWEEEVPLNTGETIVIQRSMPWELRGGFGNPFDIAMRPTRDQTIRFGYAGKQYRYIGRADVTWLAISPISKQPVLVAPAASFGWYSQNTYYCVVPYYVQLVPDASGNQWTWPEQIEPWLYDLPANLMATIPSLNERKQLRYKDSDRTIRDSTYRLQFPSGFRINANYKEDNCLSRFRPQPNQAYKS